jgi:hypothetical protein
MCGIAGIHRRVDAPEGDLARMSQALLRGIENRGRDATGVLCQFDDGDQWLRRDTVTAKKFIKKGRTYARNARTTLLHTRFATKGSPWDVRNAHPLTDEAGHIHVVHNGVLFNDDEVFEVFKLDRVTDTDTEAIPALIEEVGWDKAGDALALIDGSMAIAAVDDRHPGELLLARSDSSPLHYVVTRDLVVWASSEHAIVDGFKKAGLAPPSKESIEYMPQMHLVRVNGRVGEPERFADDPKPWYSGGGYRSYSWSWDDDWDAKYRVDTKGESGPNVTVCVPHGGLVKPVDQLPAVRGPVQDEPFPKPSVYEDIAIEVLIAQGWSADDAISEVELKGYGVAGLSLAELAAVDDEIDWDDEGDYRDEDEAGAWIDGEIVWIDDEPLPATRTASGITLVGDVALAALDRRRRSDSGRDDYLSDIDR